MITLLWCLVKRSYMFWHTNAIIRELMWSSQAAYTVEPRFTNLIHSWRPFVTRNVRKPKLFFPYIKKKPQTTMKFKRRHGEFEQRCVLSQSYASTDALPPPNLSPTVVTGLRFRYSRHRLWPETFLFGKFIRDERGSWTEVPLYVSEHYRKNNGILSDVAPISNVGLWIKVDVVNHIQFYPQSNITNWSYVTQYSIILSVMHTDIYVACEDLWAPWWWHWYAETCRSVWLYITITRSVGWFFGLLWRCIPNCSVQSLRYELKSFLIGSGLFI
jgi:hypothetical protein